MNGRPTQVQKTARPDTIWPDECPSLEETMTEEQIRLQVAHRMRGIFDVSSDPRSSSNTREVRGCFSQCFPTINARANPTLRWLRTSTKAQGSRTIHRRTWTTSQKKRYVSEFHCGMVHKPIAMKDAMKTPDAKAAVLQRMGQVETSTRLEHQENSTKVRKKWFNQRRRTEDMFISNPSWASATSNTPSLTKHLQKILGYSETYVRNSAKRNRSGRADSFAGSCTQRKPGVDHHAVQARAHVFRRIATTEVTDDKQNKIQILLKRLPRGVVTWKGTPKFVSKRWCELAATSSLVFKPVETPCMEDH